MAIYKEIKDTVSDSDLRLQKRPVDVTLFSDTVIVSTPAREDDDAAQTEAVLASFFWCIRRIAVILLRYGFLSRGCVLEGEVFHRDDLVVGPAIVEAHYYESKAAKFPRIMVTGKLRYRVDAIDRLRKWIRNSQDGAAHLHILYEFERFVDSIHDIGRTRATRESAFQFIKETCDTINRYLAETRDRTEHFEKNQWFAHYLNDAVLKRQNFETWTAWPKIIDYTAQRRKGS